MSLLLTLLAACRTTAPAAPSGPSALDLSRPPDLAINAPQPGQVLRIDFDPPAGQTLTERSTVIRYESTPGATPPDRHGETVKARMLTTFNAADGGWTLTQRINELSVSRDDQPVSDPLVQLMTEFPIKVELSADGTFQRLLNPSDAIDAVRRIFTGPKQAEAVLQFFTAEAIEAQARREWVAKYGGVLGRPLPIGTPFYSVESVGTSSGQDLSYALERTVAGVTQTGFGEAVVFKTTCLARRDAAKNPSSLDEVLKERSGVQIDSGATCEGWTVISPKPFVTVGSFLRLRSTLASRDGAGPRALNLDRLVLMDGSKLEPAPAAP